MKCTACGNTIPEGAKFCENCGNKVETPEQKIRFCPRCGARIIEGTSFCGECGEKIAANKASICKNCGAQMEAGAKFCKKCGAKAEDASAPKPQQQNVQQSASAQTVYGQYSAPSHQAPVQQAPKNSGEYTPSVQSVPSKKKKKKKKHGCLTTFLIFVIIIAILITGFISPAWAVPLVRKLLPMPEYYKNGSSNRSSASEERVLTIGDTETTGYCLIAAENTFADGTEVCMNVMSEEQAKRLESSDFTMLGSPVSLSADNYDGGYLGKDVEMRFAIPEKYVTDNTQCYFIAYHNESTGEWEYYNYDYIDRIHNEIVFTVPHFSDYVPVEVRKEKAVDIYLDRYCTNAALSKKDASKLEELLAPDLKRMMNEIGVPAGQTADAISAVNSAILSKCVQGKVNDSLGVANNIGTALYKYSKDGDEGAFLEALTQTAAEEVAKYALESKGFDTSVHPYPAKIAAGLISKSGSIVGSIETGDYKKVAEDILSIGVSLEPSTAVAMATANLLRSCANSLYNSFEVNEVEKLYQMYKNGTDDFAAGNFGDLWDSVDYSFWYGSGRAATRLYTVDHIKSYCEARGWSETDYKKLSPEKQKEINDQARKDLETYFQNRAETEQTAAEMKEREKRFINDLFGIMDSSAYSSYFGEKNGYDPNLRLKKIYEIRAKIEAMADTSHSAGNYVDWSDFVFDWVSDGSRGIDENTLLAKAIIALDKKGMLREGIEVPDLTFPTVDEISGTWSNLSVHAGNVESPLLEAILKSIAEFFGSDGKGALETNETTVTYTMKIDKISDSRIRVKLIPDDEPDLYSVYEGNYSKGKVTLRLTEDNSADKDIPGISISVNKLTLSFTRSGKSINVSGSAKLNNFLAKADFTYSGSRAGK